MSIHDRTPWKVRRERAAFRLEQYGAYLLSGRQHGDNRVDALPSSVSVAADFAPTSSANRAARSVSTS